MNQKNNKIVVNCRFLTQPISGVQRFAIEICKELKKSNFDFVFVAPRNILHQDIADQLEVLEIGNLKGHLWEQIELLRFVKQKKATLLSLCNTAPLFLKYQVITIHDLGFLINPKWFSFVFRTYYTFLIPKIAKKAQHIFTVSKSSKADIVEILKIRKEKISVVYNGVASIFKESNDRATSKSSEGYEYILSVSSLNPRKNFNRLIKAFKQLNIPNFHLVIVGNFNKYYNQENLNLDDNVIIKEHVTDEELVELYQNAKLFVYPSLYEGFGIPIIEAMSLGTKACISDIPVFREICGEYATYFDPTSIEEIKSNIKQVLKKPKEDYTRVLEKFDWQKSAEILSNKLIELRKNN